MWFTQVSLRNPVFATMVMLALMVLGLFSFQRLKVDQFPNIDFPVVVVSTAYPGASPEIVESEVTKKVEEAVNAIAGVNTLTSRSYEGQSVVIIEFQLHIDGRKAAEDVREKVATLRPKLRDEVQEPQVLRFDPASRAIWSVAVLPDATMAPTLPAARGSLPPEGAAPALGRPGGGAIAPTLPAAKPPSAVELTTWAEQTLKKRLENVRGVGSVSLVGGTQRAVNIDLDPAAMEALGVTADQVVAAVRSENQDLPVGTLKSTERDRVVQVLGRMQNPQDFEQIIVARRGGSPVRLGQVARVSDGTQEIESLALYNGQRTLLLQVQKAQDENTIAVTDGLKKVVQDMQAQLPPGVRLEPIADGSRPIRVSVDNVRRTLIEGALLTVLIVFLFLGSWRSTIITGLTLPVALLGTFFFLNVFGFTINMMTLMALSLCVGLLIDDAIVVRENIVRHVQMGKTPYDAAMDGTRKSAWRCWPPRCPSWRCSCPSGFMGGIIGKILPRVRHHHGGGGRADLDVRELHAGPDAVLGLARPGDRQARQGAWPPVQPRSFYDRTVGRVTAWLTVCRTIWPRPIRVRWLVAAHKLSHAGPCAATFVGSIAMLPLLGTEFVPKADFSETQVSFQTPVGTSIEATEAKARQVEADPARVPRGALHPLHPQHRQCPGQESTPSIYVRWWTARNAASAPTPWPPAARAPAQRAGHQRDARRPAGSGGRQQGRSSSPSRATIWPNCERLNALVLEKIRSGSPAWWTWTPRSNPQKPTVDVQLRREIASDAGLNGGRRGRQPAHPGGRADGRQLACGRRPELRRERAPGRRSARERTADLAAPASWWAATPTAAPRVVRLAQVAQVVEGSGPNQINRRNLNREVASQRQRVWPLGRRSLGRDQGRARHHHPSTRLPHRVRWLDQEHAGELRLRGLGAGHGHHLHLHDPGQPVPELPAAAGADELAAADADRRGAGAADVWLDDEHVLGHRHRAADGSGDQECHPAGGLCDPRAKRHRRRRAAGPRKRPAAGGQGAVAAHPHDHAGHGLRHGAAGLCADRGFRAARARWARRSSVGSSRLPS
jgi:HAE1 family hydrophobic/amphiphilic exporter-1